MNGQVAKWWTDDQETELVRKIDWYVMPFICLIYALSLIDRTNISVARVAGMAAELERYGNNYYSVCLLVFFPPYILFELPSNLVLQKVGANNWLPVLIGNLTCCLSILITQ